MSKIALEGNASGTGTFTIASPNSNSNYTLTLPSSTGTVVVTGGAQTIEFAAGSAASPSITFTGDTNTGIFSPGADTIAFSEGGVESMRIDSSGNVGIGTSSPSSRLEIVGVNPKLTINANDIVNGRNATLSLISGVSADPSSTCQIMYGASNSTSAGTLVFVEGDGTERMRIDSSGNVGIGTSSPSDRLQIASGGKIAVYRSDNTRAGFFYTDTTATIVESNSANSDPLRLSAPGASGRVEFYTGGSERARINSNGNLLVGTIDAGAGAGFETRIAVSSVDAAIFKTSGVGATSGFPGRFWHNATSGNNLFVDFATETAYTARGNIDYNRSAGQVRYNATSDATLKNIFGDSNGQKSLEILNSTRIREYAWKDDPTQKPQVGVIAQELYETYKGAVSVGGDVEKERNVTEEVEEEYTDEEGNTQTRTVTKVVGKETYTQYRPWGVDKTAFTFHLIAGWQAHEKLLKEAMTRIEALEAEVAALKGQ